MPQISQYSTHFKKAIEDVLGQLSGKAWRSEELRLHVPLEHAVAFLVPELGTLTLAFSSAVRRDLAALLLGDGSLDGLSDGDVEGAVDEVMRQVAGRFADSLRMLLNRQECTIKVERCEPIPEVATAFETKTEGRNGLLFGFRSVDAYRRTMEADGVADWSKFNDVEVEVKLRFGTRELTLGEILEFSPGDVVELQQRLEDPVDLLVADRVFARGEVVLIDGHYGLRVTELTPGSAA
jgi:flagellar motor switch protein FliN